MKTLTEKKSFQFLREGSGVAGSMLYCECVNVSLVR